jgi:hypothetical protein
VEICKVLDENDKSGTRSKSKKKRKGTNQGNSRRPKGKMMKPTDSDLESEEECQLANQPLAPSKPGTSSSRKRTLPPDDWDALDWLPSLSPTSSPKSPLALTSQHSKKQKLSG